MNSEEKTIQISETWMQALQAIPYVSQHRGSTIHLLKGGSAKTSFQRKRRVVEIYQTPQEFALLHG